MMILKVSQMFASANQEKMREKTLYYVSNETRSGTIVEVTHQALDVEEEHANNTVTRLI